MPFALFAPERRPRAADIYARRLAEALDVPVIALPGGGLPAPDTAAFAAARAAWEVLPQGTRPLIAEAVLPAFAPFAQFFATRRAAAVIHDTGATASDRPNAGEPRVVVMARQMLGLMPQIVVSSAAVADAISSAAALPRARMAVVEPPTPALLRVCGSGERGAAILARGALVPGNAHDVLFAALAGLRDLEWRLCIGGSSEANPEHTAELAALAERLGIAERVRVVDPTDAEECEALWQRADLFALAAARPCYGMAAAAALKRGLPVVICGDATSRPAVPAEAGAVAPPGDQAQLAKALRRLIFDRSLRQEMAEAAWRAGVDLPGREATKESLLAALG